MELFGTLGNFGGTFLIFREFFFFIFGNFFGTFLGLFWNFFGTFFHFWGILVVNTEGGAGLQISSGCDPSQSSGVSPLGSRCTWRELSGIH